MNGLTHLTFLDHSPSPQRERKDMSLSLMRNTKRVRCLIAYAAGTTARKGDGVDCNGFDTVMFMVLTGTITSPGTCAMKLQGADEDVDGSYADLTGTGITLLTGDDNKVTTLELVRPIHRYNRVVLTPAVANIVIDGAVALLGVHPRTEPCAFDASDSHYGRESTVSPVAGTA